MGIGNANNENVAWSFVDKFSTEINIEKINFFADWTTISLEVFKCISDLLEYLLS